MSIFEFRKSVPGIFVDGLSLWVVIGARISVPRNGTWRPLLGALFSCYSPVSRENGLADPKTVRISIFEFRKSVPWIFVDCLSLWVVRRVPHDLG